MIETIVVTDADERSCLATVRALGRAGYVVHTCSTREQSLAGASRHAASHTRVADPLRAPQAYVDDLVRLCTTVKAAVLLPTSEASLLAVLPERGRFACRIPFPSAEQFASVCDKEHVLELAVRHDVRVPRQQAVGNAREGRDAAMGISFPVVLKPSRSVAGASGQRTKVGVQYANDEEELVRKLEGMAPDVFPVLLQDRIEGPGFAISLLLWNGAVLAAFAHERLREKPPSGGVSVLRRAISLDKPLLAQAVALLGEFAWQGVAMVEFKRDDRTGIPYLMEINGRLWGSLQLAIDAGVDFPVLLVRSALGEFVAPVLAYNTEQRTRWELGDLDHLLLRLRRSAAQLKLPAHAPGRLRTLVDFVRGFGPGIRHEVLRADDPRPFVLELRDWLAGR